MPSIMYNDDINITNGDKRTASNIESWIDDISSHDSDPTVNPYQDGTNRNPDGWSPNQTASGGSSGETYNDTPPTEKPLPTYRTETVTLKKRTVINDYSQSYLKSLHDQGVKFYVIYSDGTENEVSYTEIYNPRQVKTEVYVNEALQIAEATDQHFWHDDSGAHVTDVKQDDWKTAAGKNFNDLSDSKPYHNILMNSLGILLRRALYNLVSVSKSAIAFYDGLGNSTTNILASFGRNGVQIGASNRKHLYMDENGVAVYNADGSLATFNAQNIQSDHITIGNIENSISDIATIRSNSQKVNGLTQSQIEATLSESRYIYISKASGTLSVSKPTSKVTETGDVQNTWTLKRPTYNSSYPVLFVSVQSVTAKGTVVFTTPAKDDTLTVIDGGHITTGTIDASRIAVDQISVGSLHDGADYATKALALNNFQQVYISKSANTTSMSAPTTWITTNSDVQNTWTTARPSYNASYPKIFTSNQTKTANGTISSSTPTLDTSTTDAISTAATDATTKANNAQSAAISAAATDATTKANAAAKTATDYITVIDSNGIKVHASNNPTTNYSKIDANGLEVIKNSTSVAKFGETARIGKLLKGYIEIGVNSSNNGYIDMYNADVLLCHIGYGTTNTSTGNNVANSPYYSFGKKFNLSNISAWSSSVSYARGSLVTYKRTLVSGTVVTLIYIAIANTQGNTPGSSIYWKEIYEYGDSEIGYNSCSIANSASMGEYSFSCGDANISGDGGFTWGRGNKAGSYSFAGGELCAALGSFSMAMGDRAFALKDYSSAFGYYTTANNSYALCAGAFNRGLTNSVFELGNGNSETNRKNAFTVLSSGAAYYSGSTTSNGTQVTSDARIKTLIDELKPETSIDFIKQLQPKHYYKEDVEEYGFYAQEVEEIPEFGEVLVTKDNSGLYDLPDYRLLDYQGMIAPIVSVEQNLIARVEQLEAENKELKLQNEKLNKRLDDIEQILANLNS